MRVYLDYGGTLHLFRKEAPDASYGKRINVPARFLVTPDQGLVQSLWLGRHRATGAVIAECYGNQEETAEVLARVAPEQYDAAEFPLVEHQQPNGVEGARYLAGRIACDTPPSIRDGSAPGSILEWSGASLCQPVHDLATGFKLDMVQFDTSTGEVFYYDEGTVLLAEEQIF